MMKSYGKGVLINNWFESSKLEEHKLDIFLHQMKNGNLMLARYRKMKENLFKPTTLTAAAGYVSFGDKVSLYAPHISTSGKDDDHGLILGGRITSNEIQYSQELEDGFSLAGFREKTPYEMSAFIIKSADYCDRSNETLKYNQEFLLAANSSVEKKRPLYLRYDPNAIPGLNGSFPLYLSEHPVSNTRWRCLPIKRHDITRFEQEGEPVQANTDIVINHVATNTNMGFDNQCWNAGFFGKICAPMMKTCLDVYGRELPNNIFQFYSPITSS